MASVAEPIKSEIPQPGTSDGHGSGDLLEENRPEGGGEAQSTHPIEESQPSEDDGYDRLIGTVVQGENGDLYVAVEDLPENDSIDMTDVINIEMTGCADGVSQDVTLVLEPPIPNSFQEEESYSEHNRNNDRRKQPVHSHTKPRTRTVMAETQDGIYELIPIMDDDDPDMQVAAIQTTETEEMGELLPQGMKIRRNRVYGSCRCPECGQTFINTARLERHLAVHQVFGSYLCPLCGKTYKYEYNLFYHWRRTCRDLNDLLGNGEDRKLMDVNQLRTLVDEVAQKKAEIGPIDIGISRSLLFQTGPLAKLEVSSNPLGRRGSGCRACGVIILSSHMTRHLQIHKGLLAVDERSSCGGYFCDLCGLMFRQHFNLIKHWRTGCPEIQANLPDDIELTLDDRQLKDMVQDLIKRAATTEIDDMDMQAASMKRHTISGNPYATAPKGGLLDEVDFDNLGNEDEERYGDDQGLVFADDFVDEDMMVSTHEGTYTVGTSGREKAKWNMEGEPVSCPECFRTFANMGRLERHLAGFHASFGAHHCILCGNRFKYDYNLLYHYRRSCPYTKSFVDRDVREQMDATSLRKVVRSLAQKDVRLTPQVGSAARLVNLKSGVSNDELVRRQMLKMPGPGTQPPPQMMIPKIGVSMEAKCCPICSIVFYGMSAIERHMRAAHGVEYGSAVEETQGEEYTDEHGQVYTTHEEEEEDDPEPPPLLEPETEGERPPPIATSSLPKPPSSPDHQSIIHPHRQQTIIQLRTAEGEIVQQMAVNDIGDIQQLMESGQLQIEDGDQIVLVEGDEDEQSSVPVYDDSLPGPSQSINPPLSHNSTLSRPPFKDDVLVHRKRGRPVTVDSPEEIVRKHRDKLGPSHFMVPSEVNHQLMDGDSHDKHQEIIYQDADGNIIHPDDIDPNDQVEEIFLQEEEVEGVQMVMEVEGKGEGEILMEERVQTDEQQQYHMTSSSSPLPATLRKRTLTQSSGEDTSDSRRSPRHPPGDLPWKKKFGG